MKKYLPSWRILVLIIGITVAFGVYYYTSEILPERRIAKLESKAPQTEALLNSLSSGSIVTTVGESKDLDTDGDGLKDWEEALWKLDPNIADTDGDGISDYLFVESQRSQIRQANVFEDDSNEFLSTTDIFTREIYMSIIALKATDQYDVETKNNLAKAVIGYTASGVPDINFTKKDVELAGERVSAYEEYMTGFERALKANPLNVDIINEVLLDLESGKEVVASVEYAGQLDSYTSLLKDLLAIKVPEGIANEHIDFVNNIADVQSHAIELTYLPEDPLRGWRALLGYRTAVNEYVDSLYNVTERLQNILL